MNFDQKAETYDTAHRLNRAQKISEEITSYFTSGPMHVLEFGCGTGAVANLLAKRPTTMTLIDRSQKMIEMVKEKCKQNAHTHISAHAVDILEFEPDRTYDVIYTSLALHHITDVKAVLAKLGSLLSPTGQLIIVELLPDNGAFHEADSFEGHHGFSIDEMSQYLVEAGLTPSIGRKFFSGYKQLETGDKHPYSLFSISAKK